MGMPLKPQDVIVALKLVTCHGSASDETGGKWPSFSNLGLELGISSSEVHASVMRGTKAGLLGPGRKPRKAKILEFLLHGVRFAFFAERGSVTRGMPTAHAAPPLSDEIAGDDLPPVWPDPEGKVRGETLEPLYRTAPTAAKNDPQLYELLALVDAIRIGRARERVMAEGFLRERLV